MSRTQQRIVLTGFMGAGKTTVARALARRLGCDALDLDDLITEREGRTPQELIDEDGEASFREAETRALREVLGAGTSRVIATGGGAWTMERNRALVAECGCLSVWLDAPFDLCWQRIRESAADRPFARDREQARRLYDERLAAYRLAGLRVRVGPQSDCDEIATEIVAASGMD